MAVCALTLYPRFVVKVEASGITPSAREILTAYGIEEGNFLWSLDEGAVAGELLKLDGVAFAEVTRRGTRVYVTLAPELEADSYVSLSGGAVTASRAATVTRIIVFGGTAAVEVGDTVERGQVLILDSLTVREENIPSSASGEVYGVTDYSVTRFFPDTVIDAVRGETKKYSRLSFFGSAVKAPASPFDASECKYSAEKNMFLFPYVVHTWSYTELKTAERTNNLTEEQMKEETISSIVTDLPASAQVKGSTAEIKRIENGFSVSVTVSVEERIDNA